MDKSLNFSTCQGRPLERMCSSRWFWLMSKTMSKLGISLYQRIYWQKLLEKIRTLSSKRQKHSFQGSIFTTKFISRSFKSEGNPSLPSSRLKLITLFQQSSECRKLNWSQGHNKKKKECKPRDLNLSISCHSSLHSKRIMNLQTKKARWRNQLHKKNYPIWLN